MSQHPSTEVAVANVAAAASKAKAKKIARVSGAAAFTFAMFGALALPAYAMDNERPSAETAPVAAVQTMTVTAGPALAPIDDIPLEVESSLLAQERRQAEIVEAQKLATERAKVAVVEIPAGVGAGGLVAAALAQLGVSQDCTDLVQNSLAAIGLTARRDQGGYDLGVTQFTRFGASTPYVHGVTELAPGDILLWGGAHVAIFIGNGAVVHGGWDGFTTVVAGLSTYHGLPTSVVRMS